MERAIQRAYHVHRGEEGSATEGTARLGCHERASFRMGPGQGEGIIGRKCKVRKNAPEPIGRFEDMVVSLKNDASCKIECHVTTG
jgi:hypothetical protein